MLLVIRSHLIRKKLLLIPLIFSSKIIQIKLVGLKINMNRIRTPCSSIEIVHELNVARILMSCAPFISILAREHSLTHFISLSMSDASKNNLATICLSSPFSLFVTNPLSQVSSQWSSSLSLPFVTANYTKWDTDSRFSSSPSEPPNLCFSFLVVSQTLLPLPCLISSNCASLYVLHSNLLLFLLVFCVICVVPCCCFVEHGSSYGL
jgi:hypothetical protein